MNKEVSTTAGTTDEVVGWPLGDVHLWGDECTNGRWGDHETDKAVDGRPVTGNAAAQ